MTARVNGQARNAEHPRPIDPPQVASIALRFLERVACTRAEWDTYAAVEAMLVAIANGAAVLVPPDAPKEPGLPEAPPDVGGLTNRP